jgi:hypothetical protein
MNYNVIGPDGAVYGPVDEATLTQWAAEARVLPTTMLEEVGSGRRFEAKTMASLFPPQSAPAPSAPAQPSSSVFHSGYEAPKTSTTGIGQVGPGGIGATPAAQRLGVTPGYTSSTAYAPIDNHLLKAIISILFFWPLSIVSIVFAAQVNGKLADGDRLGAQESADKANLFANIAFWLGGFGYVVMIGLWILMFVVLAHSGPVVPPPAH